VIQWMNEHGPTGGGASGPGEDAYYLLMRGDCKGTLAIAKRELRGDTLYAGVAWACLAAFEGRADLWPRADAAYARNRSEAARFDCETRAVYELLRRLVEAHRADPSARLVKQRVGRRELVCPRFTGITPDHGPEEGGYTVRIEGRNLPHVVNITWFNEYPDTHHFSAVSQDGRHVEITVPPAFYSPGEPSDGVVQPDGARAWSDSAVRFTYDPPITRTQPSSSSSTSTSTTTPDATESTSTSTQSPPSS
jgi:hypothetical protein